MKYGIIFYIRKLFMQALGDMIEKKYLGNNSFQEMGSEDTREFDQAIADIYNIFIKKINRFEKEKDILNEDQCCSNVVYYDTCAVLGCIGIFCAPLIFIPIALKVTPLAWTGLGVCPALSGVWCCSCSHKSIEERTY